MTPVLTVDNLTKRYSNGTLANDSISFTVNAGTVVGLLGDNGAGKTTLVRQIAGLAIPTSGTIELNGIDVGSNPAAARKLCSLQAQAQVPITGLTPRQAISLVGRLRGAESRDVREKLALLAERLNFEEWLDRIAMQGRDVLTGGIRRLVAFSMAAIAPGPLLVLDEPTNDVDPIRRRLLWQEIRSLADRGHAVLLVTHNVAEAERSVDRVLIMHRGRVVADGSPALLAAAVNGLLRVEITWATAHPPSVPGYLREPTVTPRGLTATMDRSSFDEAVNWSTSLRDAGQLDSFSVSTTSLEDVYDRVVEEANIRFAGLIESRGSNHGAR